MKHRIIARLSQRIRRTLPSCYSKILGIGAVGLLAAGIISCSTLQHAIVAPPDIPGATFVGTDTCANCHAEIVRDFVKTADHSRLMADGKNAQNTGCEGCHGPGSLHANSGGSTKLIVNPRKDPEACLKCHLDIRSKFELPYRHAVMEGRMSCVDCHNPHKGSITKGGGATNLMGKNEVCFQCHTLQRGPFVFEHEALREGCTTCHDPHGSVNQKLLIARNSMLCLKCHFQTQTGPAGGAPVPGQLAMGKPNGGVGHAFNVQMGACWSAGCHEAVHGSQVNQYLRY